MAAIAGDQNADTPMRPDDLAARLARARLDGGQRLLVDELLDRHAGDAAAAADRHHVVAVAAEHHRLDVLHRHAGGLGHEVAVARRVEGAGHAHQLVLRRVQLLVEAEHDRVQRVRDRDDDRVRAELLDGRRHGVGDLQVDGQQLFAARERAVRPDGARHAGGVDDEVGVLDDVVFLARLEPDVAADDRACPRRCRGTCPSRRPGP